MTSPHRISVHTLQRAAHGHRGKSVDVGRQASPGPVTMTAEFHLEVTRETEADCRAFLTRIEQVLFECCTEVAVEGPYLKRQEPHPRRHQQ